MFEWWMLILIGVALGWFLHDRKHKILWFFKDEDSQLHMMVAGILGLAGFGMVGIFVGAFLNLVWLCLVGVACYLVFVAIMVVIYQPWKKFRRNVKARHL